MDVAEFKRILTIGLGRAILHLQTHDATPYLDAILDVCLHCPTYDPQTENREPAYLFEIIELTDKASYFRDPILSAFAKSPMGDDMDTWQLFALAYEFAKRGDSHARQIMYDQAVANIGEGHVTGVIDILTLDGIEGLKFAAEQVGEALNKQTSPSSYKDIGWYSAYIETEFEQKSGNYIWEALTQATTTKPQISRFIQEIDEYRKQQRSELAAIQAAATKSRKLRLEEWALQADEDAILYAAEELLEERDTELLKRYLRVFGVRPFPLAPERLIDLSNHEDWIVASYAFRALDQITHPSIRAYALQRLEKLELWQSMGLLVNNFQPGDYELIRKITQQDLNDNQIHHIGYDVREIVKKISPPRRYLTVTLFL